MTRGDKLVPPGLSCCRCRCLPFKVQRCATATLYLVSEHNLTRKRAYAICSICADLKISQIVDALNFLVSAVSSTPYLYLAL
jgi:acetamidase/formamidase